jgi:hypothetical protein
MKTLKDILAEVESAKAVPHRTDAEKPQVEPHSTKTPNVDFSNLSELQWPAIEALYSAPASPEDASQSWFERP